MATTEILASGTTVARSTEVTVASGAAATLLLKDAAGPAVDPGAVAQVQMKSADTQWMSIGELNGTDKRAVVVSGPGVFSVYREGAAVAFGVDSST